jgi:hypothetical protein
MRHIGETWVASAAFMVVIWAAIHAVAFIAVGGPIAWLSILLIDTYAPSKWIESVPVNALLGSVLGLLFCPVCLLPFAPFWEPGDPSYLSRYIHYSPLTILAGFAGGWCFGTLMRQPGVETTGDLPLT